MTQLTANSEAGFDLGIQFHSLIESKPSREAPNAMVTSDRSETVLLIAPESADFEQRLNEERLLCHPTFHQLSTWSKSSIKRGFDILGVILGLPLALPILVAVSLAVRLTSRGPVLFLQTRSGKNGTTFKIYKFRTIEHHGGACRSCISTVGNQDFTSIGPSLRKWKLDELPQILNILRGEMSLVGPRPKVPEHERALLSCRPGLTGAATLAFAREEFILDRIPKSELNALVENVVLPLKKKIDSDYMSQATFLSDLNLILKSVFRRWRRSGLEAVLDLDRAGAGTNLHAQSGEHFPQIIEDFSQLSCS